MCTAEGQGLPGWFPPVWISGIDSSDPANGVHCQPIGAPFGAAAKRVLELLARGLP